MHRNNEENVCGIIDKINRLVKKTNSHAEMLMETMKDLNELAVLIENASVDAEQDGDLEILKTLAFELLPMFNHLDMGYSSLANVLRKILISKEIQQYEVFQNQFISSIPKLTHIVMNITGNTGDYILGHATRRLVETEKDRVIDWQVNHVIHDVDDEYIRKCNQSKGVVIGGGGLLLKDTNPNSLSGWTWPCSTEMMRKIEVPIYVLGIGYNRFRGQEEFDDCFTESINQLVEKATFFGLRNHGSIRAVKNYLREDLKDKVRWHPCATTVLGKIHVLPERNIENKYIAVNCAFDRVEKRLGENWEKKLIEIANVVKILAQEYQIKLYVQCNGDEQFANVLDILEVNYEIVTLTKALTEEEYLHYYTEPELVLAMRGHAQMIPFGCKTPVVSIISHDKLAWFLEDIEHPEWGVDVRDEEFEQKLLAKSLYMLEHREEVCAQIEEAQDKLWAIMQENLKSVNL